MGTTTGDNTVFDSVKDWLGDNSIDLNTNAYGVLLLDSTLEPNRATDQFVSDISANELATANGYTRKILANPLWTTSGGANGQMKFDADNPVWTASGGSIVCHWWVLFNNTPATDAAKNLVNYGLLDVSAGGTTVTTTDGNTLTLNVAANGFFTVG